MLASCALLALGTALVDAGEGTARADDKSRCIKASEQGQQLRDAGKYQAARDAFTQCSRDACPAIVRRDCTRWLADLTQLWPSVVLGAKDAKGNDKVDVTVSIDGTPLASSLDGKPVQVDPGQHTFRFEAQGSPAVERQVLVRAGDKSRQVVAQFGDVPASGGDAAKPASAPGPDAAAASPPIPTGVWVFGGLAIVAFGTEAYFGLTGLGDRSSLESNPCARTSTCSSDSVNSVRTKFTIADIALGVGIVSAGLSAYLYFSRGSAVKVDAAQTSFDVAPVPGGAAGTWKATF